MAASGMVQHRELISGAERDAGARGGHSIPRRCIVCAAVLLNVLAVFAVSAESSSDALAAGKPTAVATFAGGCFWCMEPPFDGLNGVSGTISGYIGGDVSNPTYEQVSAGGTGHTEAVQISFNPDQITYAELLRVFWRNIDPTTPDRQFCDRGTQYRPAIFYHDEAQHRAALESLAGIEQSKTFQEPVRVEIAPAGDFYPAESYHQDYYLKNPHRYKFYRYSCGRDKRLKELWGAGGS